MSASLLSGHGLARYYSLGREPVAALRGVDIHIDRRDFVALQGPSGSGKTTLINILGLLDRPDAGTLALDGLDTSTLAEDDRADLRRDRFGFVFQSFNLIPVLTAAENVGYPMTLRGRPVADVERRANELLATVGLSEKSDVRPDLLSGGQRQRVAIARALANDPDVVFADEPTANLDSVAADAILDLMAHLNRDRGVAFVFATHDPRIVARARRVVILHDGRITSSP